MIGQKAKATLQTIGWCVLVIACLMVSSIVNRLAEIHSEYPHHPAPDIKVVFQTAEHVSLDYRGQAHLSSFGDHLAISVGDTRGVEILNPFSISPALLHDVRIGTEPVPDKAATYEFLITVMYKGYSEEDEEPMFAYNARTGELVYLNHPGQYAIASEAFRKAVLARVKKRN